eukprot:scaffold289546_cov39-Prasinocladus_malaysianus.AAC.1
MDGWTDKRNKPNPSGAAEGRRNWREFEALTSSSAVLSFVQSEAPINDYEYEQVCRRGKRQTVREKIGDKPVSTCATSSLTMH